MYSRWSKSTTSWLSHTMIQLTGQASRAFLSAVKLSTAMGRSQKRLEVRREPFSVIMPTELPAAFQYMAKSLASLSVRRNPLKIRSFFSSMLSISFRFFCIKTHAIILYSKFYLISSICLEFIYIKYRSKLCLLLQHCNRFYSPCAKPLFLFPCTLSIFDSVIKHC